MFIGLYPGRWETERENAGGKSDDWVARNKIAELSTTTSPLIEGYTYKKQGYRSLTKR